MNLELICSAGWHAAMPRIVISIFITVHAMFGAHLNDNVAASTYLQYNSKADEWTNYKWEEYLQKQSTPWIGGF